MKAINKNLVMTWVSVLLGTISFNIVVPFYVPMIKKLGAVENIEFWSGMIYSASYLAGVFFSPIWGSLADKYGRKYMMIRGSLGCAVVYFLISICMNNYQYLVLQLIIGILAGFVSACIAFIASDAKEEDIPFSLAFIHTASATGCVVGPIIGGMLMSKLSIENNYRVAGIILIVCTLIILFCITEDKSTLIVAKSSIYNDIKYCLRNKSLLNSIVIVLLMEIGLCLSQPVLTLCVEQFRPEFDVNLTTGIVFSLVGIAAMLTATNWGISGKRLGLRKIITIGLLGAGIFSVPQFFAANVVQFIVFRFIYGIFAAGLVPNTNTLVASSSPNEFRARAFGITGSVVQLGGVIGPLVGGAIAGCIGTEWVFIVTAVVLLFTLIFAKKIKND